MTDFQNRIVIYKIVLTFDFCRQLRDKVDIFSTFEVIMLELCCLLILLFYLDLCSNRKKKVFYHNDIF